MKNLINKTKENIGKAADAWEECTNTQTSRTGQTASRIASALAHGVDREVIALQMTKNSQRNNPDSSFVFTPDDIISIVKFHAANQSSPVLTKQQTKALIREQSLANSEGDDLDLVPQ